MDLPVRLTLQHEAFTLVRPLAEARPDGNIGWYEAVNEDGESLSAYLVTVNGTVPATTTQSLGLAETLKVYAEGLDSQTGCWAGMGPRIRQVLGAVPVHERLRAIGGAEGLARQLMHWVAALQEIQAAGWSVGNLTGNHIVWPNQGPDTRLAGIVCSQPLDATTQHNDWVQLGLLVGSFWYPSLTEAEHQLRARAATRRREPLLDFDPAHGRWNNLIAGLTLHEPTLQWRYAEVQRWLQGDNPPVNYLTEAEKRTPPLELPGMVGVRSATELAEALTAPEALAIWSDPSATAALFAWLARTTDRSTTELEHTARYYLQESAEFAAVALRRTLGPELPLYNAPFFHPRHQTDWKATLVGFFRQYDHHMLDWGIEQHKALWLDLELLLAHYLPETQPVLADLYTGLGLTFAPTLPFRASLYGRLSFQRLVQTLQAWIPDRVFRPGTGPGWDTLAHIQDYFRTHPNAWHLPRFKQERLVALKQMGIAGEQIPELIPFLQLTESTATLRLTAHIVNSYPIQTAPARPVVRLTTWVQGYNSQSGKLELNETRRFDLEEAQLLAGTAVFDFLKPQASSALNDQPMLTLHGHYSGVNDLVFTPDGQLVVSVGDDSTVKLWDVATGQTLRTYLGHSKGVLAAALHPQGHLLATAGRDHQITIYETLTGRKLTGFSGHTDRVTHLCFGHTGNIILSSGYDSTVRLWSVERGRLIRTHRLHLSFVNGLVQLPGLPQTISVGKDLRLIRFDYDSEQEIQAASVGETPQDEPRSLELIPHTEQLVLGFVDGRMEIRDIHRLTVVQTIRAHRSLVAALAVHPSGTWMVSGDVGGKLVRTDLRTYETRPFSNENFTGCRILHFNPQGDVLSIGEGNGTIRFLSLATDSLRPIQFMNDPSAQLCLEAAEWLKSPDPERHRFQHLGTVFSESGPRQ
jgi:WD40 repeat protein